MGNIYGCTEVRRQTSAAWLKTELYIFRQTLKIEIIVFFENNVHVLKDGFSTRLANV